MKLWREGRLKESPFREDNGQVEIRPRRSGGKDGIHSREDRRQPDEIGIRNGTSREDSFQDSGHEELSKREDGLPKSDGGQSRRKKAVVVRKEIPNEEAAIHSLRECRREK
jgi:hypothetical protein